MKLAFILILLITISSCKQEKIDANASIVVNRIVQACKEERENAQDWEWYRELLVELKEPKIDSSHITYIFQLRLPYSKEYRFRIQENSDSTFTLLSKAYGSATLQSELPDSIPYRTLKGPSRLVESEQVFTRQELDTFKTLLEGSFYWTWIDPYKMNYGFADGGTWNLESVDYIPRDTAKNPRLQYHSNFVYEPVYSSYTVACIYLIQKSKLLKRLPFLKAYTDYYMKHKGDFH